MLAELINHSDNEVTVKLTVKLTGSMLLNLTDFCTGF